MGRCCNPKADELNSVVASTKTCSKCKRRRAISCFAKRETGKPHSYCRNCQSAYCKEHYKRNKERHNSSRYTRMGVSRISIRRLIGDLKKDRPCMDCGEVHPTWAMEFDHRDPKMKLFSVGEAVSKGMNREAVLAEIEKCDLVCTLCHRYRTYGQRRGLVQR